jgi:hypothetical protein
MTKKNDKRPIVCGTDFSAVATGALNIAAAMARQLETKLLLWDRFRVLFCIMQRRQ